MRKTTYSGQSARRRFSALLCLALAATVLAGPAPAIATPAAPTPDASSGGSGPIGCSISTQTPHHATARGGNINVSTTVSCNAPVPRMVVWIDLYTYPHYQLVGARKVTLYGARSVELRVSIPCRGGSFIARGTTEVFFPAGYRPDAIHIYASGGIASLGCNGASSPPPQAAP